MSEKRMKKKFKVGDKVWYISRGSKSWSGCVICSTGTGTISKIAPDKMFPTWYHVNEKGRDIVCGENQLVKMV